MIKIKAPRWSASKFKELGRGGEAVVYKLKDGKAAKIFLQANNAQYKDFPDLQEAARVRLSEMQSKLRSYPKGLPPQFVAPEAVLIDKNESIFGYVMPLIDGQSLDKITRINSGTSNAQVVEFLKDLHQLISKLHAKGVIIGDLNENNIIVSKGKPWIIDTDAAQFGGFICRSFTPRFTAPELMGIVSIQKPKRGRKKAAPQELNQLRLVAPHSELTDWYSYLIIAMRLMTSTDPFGGIVKDMALSERICKGITVFEPQVTYPIVARPLRSLPRPILEVFFRAFKLRQRFIPDPGAFDTYAVQATAPAPAGAAAEPINKAVARKKKGRSKKT